MVNRRLKASEVAMTDKEDRTLQSVADALVEVLMENHVRRFVDDHIVVSGHRAVWLAIAKVAQEQAELYE
jgi:CTP:molybdopterin cytidylyltransferase MocA